MDLFRRGFDKFYDLTKPFIFRITDADPEKAHQLLTSFLKTIYSLRVDRLILDNKTNYVNPGFKLSNAAGFNKNAEIPPIVLKYLGFDRVVIGTVTNEPWHGNPRPRSMRFPETDSLVNWMGLPGDGAKVIAERLASYRSSNIPITISLMSTPQKKGDALLKDLKGTVLALRDSSNVDRFELNISCPNTSSREGIDVRSEYQNQHNDMIILVEELLLPHQDLYLKISPDLDFAGVQEIFSVLNRYNVAGFTVTNTTTTHNPAFIPKSPEKGGASGNAVYDSSINIQKLFYQIIKAQNLDYRLIACGGINSAERVKERLANGADEIQLYTPLIFSGPKLLRNFRTF